MVMNITSVFKIHDTVLQVSYEAQTLMPEMPVIKSENKLLSELVLCILSSQEKYEVALAMMKSLRKENILRIPKTNQSSEKSNQKLKALSKIQFVSSPTRKNIQGD